MRLASAITIIEHAVKCADELNLKPPAVTVLDAGGLAVAAQRQDGTSNRRGDIACGKAHGAISLGVGSRALGALGVSGDTSDNDEVAAVAGIRAAGFRPQVA